MKSEHRHDLQTNELGKAYEKSRELFEKHGNRLMLALCAVSLVASALIWWYRSSSAHEAAAWRDFFSSRDAERLADVGDTHQKSPAALWARVHEGETRLATGVEKMFTNIELGRKEIKQAAAAFEVVLSKSKAPRELRERALFGRARCLEAQSDGELAEAVKAYEAFISEFPESIRRKDAESRVAVLKSSSGQEFYAWFSRYERPKASEKRPRDTGSDAEEEDDEDVLKRLESAAKAGSGGPSLGNPGKSEDDEAVDMPADDSDSGAGRPSADDDDQPLDAPSTDEPASPDKKPAADKPEDTRSPPAEEKNQPESGDEAAGGARGDGQPP